MQARLGGKPEYRAELAVYLLVLLLLAPGSAFADAQDFFPRLYSTEGELEVDMAYQSDENTAAGRGVKTRDSSAVEKLRLGAVGFVYHPRFIQFKLKGSGGLSQEEFKSSYGNSFRSSTSATEYEARLKMLPEHPYNLEFYTWRITPLSLGRFSAETRPTDSEKGGIFNYAEKPLFFNLSYNENRIESRIFNSESRTRRAAASYLLGPMNNVAGYTHTDASTSTFLRTARDESFFNNTIGFTDVTLYSEIRQLRLKQNSPITDNLVTDTTSWTEQFSANLPWNFNTALSYLAQKDKVTNADTASGTAAEQANETKNASFIFSHKLYDSVRTNYVYNFTSSHSSSGDTKTVLNSLNGVYTKRVPTGRLTAGAMGSRVIIDRENSPLIVGENYSAALYRNFILTRENIDIPTISVKVISDTGALIDLTRDTHYIVEQAGSTIVITIVSLPQEILSGHTISHTYAFFVSYTLITSTVKFQVNTIGYNFSLALFDNLLNPYYNHLTTKQEVISGAIPGGPKNTDTDIIGLIVQKAPYTLLSEYRTIQSDAYPSTTNRNTAEYLKSLSDTSSLSLKANYSKTVYSAGTLGTAGYTEYLRGFDMRYQKSMPHNNLNFSLGASYSQRHSTVDTELLSGTTTLMWHAGQLTVNLGASVYDSSATGSLGRQKMLTEYYYASVTRKLF